MFCPQCGVEIPEDSAFCPICGAEAANSPPPTPDTTAAVAPEPSATQPLPTAPAPQQGQAAPRNKTGLIVAIVLVVFLLLGCCVAGSLFAGLKWFSTVEQNVIEELEVEPDTGVIPEPPTQETPSEEAEPGPPSEGQGVVNAETAVDAVGNLLNSLKENDVEAARAHATRRFQEDESWFFAPAGGALASFEVTDVYQDQGLWVVEVAEDWNSGPQRSRYFVIEEDHAPRVDGVDFLEW